MPKAIFLDKDGTLVKNIPYNVDTNLIVFNDNMLHGLKLLSKMEFLFIIVTNQSGVGRGYFSIAALENVKRVLFEYFESNSIQFADFLFCPHFKFSSIEEYAKECECRKPRPGLMFEAASKHNIDLEASWVIGDSETDVEAGLAAGCKTVLISERSAITTKSTLVAKDINEAARKLLFFR